jgi:tRNA-dihydrouridine synthase A
MMDWTDRHCRFLLRQLSAHTLLYTEMITTGALLHGDVARHLRFDDAEHPVALQLGGSDPDALARCSALGEQWGYDEINLNCGCPSDRVQEGRFGACLMREPAHVAACVRAMRSACNRPVTVKCRTGIGRGEDFQFLLDFVDRVAEAGARHFIVHARNAWLEGLSPQENRTVPPLRPQWVHELKRLRPELTIVLNGGVRSLEECHAHLGHVDGVMLGREAYENPYLLADVDRLLFGEVGPARARSEVVERLIVYAEREMARGTPLHAMTRHWLGLYRGLPGARSFRRILSEGARRPAAGVQLISDALAAVQGCERTAA